VYLLKKDNNEVANQARFQNTRELFVETEAAQTARPRVALLVPYFGRLPLYLNYFLLTAKYNQKTLDVFIFYEHNDATKIPADIPANVHFFKFNQGELETFIVNRASRLLNHSLPLFTTAKRKKICDYRPLFGSIFQEYLVNHTHWGWGDIDVLYGDLSHFISISDLNDFDVITLQDFQHGHHLSGAFSLFKNNEHVNDLWRRVSKNQLIEQLSQVDKVHATDERLFGSAVPGFADLNVKISKCTAQDSFVEKYHYIPYWQNGKVYVYLEKFESSKENDLAVEVFRWQARGMKEDATIVPAEKVTWQPYYPGMYQFNRFSNMNDWIVRQLPAEIFLKGLYEQEVLFEMAFVHFFQGKYKVTLSEDTLTVPESCCRINLFQGADIKSFGLRPSIQCDDI